MILRAIKKNLVMKCLEMSAEIAEKKDDYTQFYEQFGDEQTSLKETRSSGSSRKTS